MNLRNPYVFFLNLDLTVACRWSGLCSTLHFWIHESLPYPTVIIWKGTSLTSSNTSEIWRSPRHATFTSDFTVGDFFKPCASLPNQLIRGTEWPSWKISFCFLWHAIILVCQVAVACHQLNSKNKVIRPCLDSLGREMLSQCLRVHVCKCTKKTKTIQKWVHGSTSGLIWLLTQLRHIQPGILHSCF